MLFLQKVNVAVKGSQTFQGFKNFTVPSDYGLAAFLMAAASIVPSAVELRGCFDDGLIQADGHILKFLKTMGAKWTRAENAIVMKGPFKLKGGTFSLQDCPDLVPIMAVIALFAKSPTVLKNIHHARAKESDRISGQAWPRLEAQHRALRAAMGAFSALSGHRF